jgi:hypothetical protein
VEEMLQIVRESSSELEGEGRNLDAGTLVEETLEERLKVFLPRLKEENEKLTGEDGIENVDDEEEHIEMVLSPLHTPH